jgi:hypothetical protein
VQETELTRGATVAMPGVMPTTRARLRLPAASSARAIPVR